MEEKEYQISCMETLYYISTTVLSVKPLLYEITLFSLF
jgi:hypothetical protein